MNFYKTKLINTYNLWPSTVRYYCKLKINRIEKKNQKKTVILFILYDRRHLSKINLYTPNTACQVTL